MTLNDLHIYLIFGLYGFTAGSYIFTWKVYQTLTNHYESRIKHLERMNQQRAESEQDNGRI